MKAFWELIDSYTPLSSAAKEDWLAILKTSELKKGAYFLLQGSVPKKVAFISKGLLSYDYINAEGKKTTKKFFAENSLVASTSALLKQEAGIFSIQAIEDCQLIIFPFNRFKELVSKHADIAAFYICYLERHWVIEKEFSEITLKEQTAKQRYLQFINEQPQLFARLKLHHLASYLSITPTQISRIRAEI